MLISLFFVLLNFHPLFAQNEGYESTIATGSVFNEFLSSEHRTEEQALSKFNSLFKLKPDNRLHYAYETLWTFSGKKALKIQFISKGNKWEIKTKENVIAEISEFPSFMEMETFLINQAKQINSKYKLTFTSCLQENTYSELQHEIERFSYLDLLNVLNKSNNLWSTCHDKKSIEIVAKAFSRLVFQMLDQIGIADDLIGKSLGFIIQAELHGFSLAKEKAMIAHLMGYTNEAKVIASKFSDNDSFKLYLEKKSLKLGNLAEQGKNPEDDYLSLLAMHGGSTHSEWKKYAGELLQKNTRALLLPILKLAIDLQMFEINYQILPQFPSTIYASLLEEGKDKGFEQKLKVYFLQLKEVFLTKNIIAVDNLLAIIFYKDQNTYKEVMKEITSLVHPYHGLLEKFELALTDMSSHYQGPFLNANEYQKFYHATFYSGLWATASMYYHQRGRPQEAKEYIVGLSMASENIYVSAIHDYFMAIIAMNGGGEGDGRNTKEIWEILKNHKKILGIYPNLTLLEEFGIMEEAFVIYAIKEQIPWMDTRPLLRRQIASLLYNRKIFVPAENFYQSIPLNAASDNEAEESFKNWLSQHYSEWDKLTEIYKDKNYSSRERLKAFHFLETHKKLQENEIKYGAAAIAEDAKGDYATTLQYTNYLLDKNEVAQALEVISKWIANTQERGLTMVDANVKKSKILFDQEKYEESWKIIQPYIDSNKNNALLMGARILRKLKRFDEAKKLLKQSIGTYEYQHENRAMLAQYYWESGDYTQAANIINPKELFNFFFNIIEWDDNVAPYYYEAMEGKSQEEIKKSLVALYESKTDRTLMEMLAQYFRQKHKFETAMIIYEHLSHDDQPKSLYFLVQALPSAQALLGIEKAQEWFMEKTKRFADNSAAPFFAFSDNQHTFFWDIVQKPEDFFSNQNDLNKLGVDINQFWFFRTYFWYLHQSPYHDKKAAIQDYIHHTKDEDFNTVSIKFMLGQASSDQVLKKASNQDDLCTAFHIIGMKYKINGELVKASQFLSMSMMTFRYHNTEYAKSLHQLKSFYDNGLSIQLQEKNLNDPSLHPMPISI